MARLSTTRTIHTVRTGLLGALALALAVAGALLAVGAGAGRAVAPAPGARVAATHVVRLSPVTASGVRKPGWRVTTRRSGGTCHRGSEAVGEGAYRCFAHNTVFDPCWVQRGGRGQHVLCAASPWRRDVARVAVRHLHAASGTPRNVWGIRLVSGRRCTFLQGASVVHHGQRVSYGCGGHLYLYGEPDRSSAVWQIGAATFRHGRFRHDHRVRIARAVLGAKSPTP